MPALDLMPKGHAKAQLIATFDKLTHGLQGKPRLSTVLKPQMEKWKTAIDKVPDAEQTVAVPVNQNENAAFIERIKKNAAAHDFLLGRLQDMMAVGTEYGEAFKKKLRKARGLVEQDVQQWDLQQANYDREVNSHAQRSQDARNQYHQTLKDLRVQLEAMRVRYNQGYMFEELLDDDSRSRYFLNTSTCIGYVPSQHCWMPHVGKYTHPHTKAVTKGTYVYDFRVNAFQLHIHCNPHDGEVRTIRTKLYGEDHGEYSNLIYENAIIAKAFRTAYPPDASGYWVQV